MAFGCENLECWKRARELAVEIYRISDTGNLKTDFRLKREMRGLAVAVPTQIAKGQAQGSPAGFIRGLKLAKASASGLRTQIVISRDVGYLGEGDYLEMEDRLNQVEAMLGGLIKSLKARVAAANAPEAQGDSAPKEQAATGQFDTQSSRLI